MDYAKNFSNLKPKLGLLILLIVVFFFVFDIGGLLSIDSAVQMSDISENHLYSVKQALFSLYLLKFFQLFLLLSACILIIYWIVKPYWLFLSKFQQMVRKSPTLSKLVAQENDELKKAEKVLEVIFDNWKEPQFPEDNNFQ